MEKLRADLCGCCVLFSNQKSKGEWANLIIIIRTKKNSKEKIKQQS